MGDSHSLAALHRIKGKFSGIVGGRRTRKHSKRKRRRKTAKRVKTCKRRHAKKTPYRKFKSNLYYDN